MWERYVALAPAAFIWLVIGILFWIVRTSLERLIARNFHDKEWRDKHRGLRILTDQIGSIITAPTLEEIAFRLPLLILFAGPWGWGLIGLVVSSVLFGLVHITNDHTDYGEVLSKPHADMAAFRVAMKEAKAAQREKTRKIVMLQVVATCIGGYVMGYAGLYYGSITVSIVIHAVWNTFVTAVFSVLMHLVAWVLAIVLVLGRKFNKLFK